MSSAIQSTSEKQEALPVTKTQPFPICHNGRTSSKFRHKISLRRLSSEGRGIRRPPVKKYCRLEQSKSSRGCAPSRHRRDTTGPASRRRPHGGAEIGAARRCRERYQQRRCVILNPIQNRMFHRSISVNAHSRFFLSFVAGVQNQATKAPKTVSRVYPRIRHQISHDATVTARKDLKRVRENRGNLAGRQVHPLNKRCIVRLATDLSSQPRRSGGKSQWPSLLWRVPRERLREGANSATKRASR